MKIKWLLILFAIYIGIMLISLLFTQQDTKNVYLEQKEISTTAETINQTQLFSSPKIGKTSTSLAQPKSGITIIKTPSVQTENTPKAIVERKTETVNSNRVAENNISSNLSLDPKTEEASPQQTGITKIGKYPSPKEAQEMNSKGIVLY